MKRINITFLLTLVFAYVLAQNTLSTESDIQTEVICPGEVPVELLTPEEQQRQAEFEEMYRAAILQKRADGTINQKMQGQIYTIPVVVHIIHDGQEVGTVQNPDEATVNAYIQEANEHFSHTQPGAKTYNNPNYGVDTEIQFCLASTDPDGNYTNGVVRHYAPEYYYVDYIKTARYAESVVWDNAQYLNIFINYTTNVLGIHIGQNGVIMRNIGFNGTFFCHEVGHWLGLRHTFQGGCTNNDCTTDGDGVCDTPPKSSAGYSGSCSDGQNNCTADENDTSSNNPYRSISLGGMGEQPDMVENYMDYTQPCYDSYTLGQKIRMRSYHENYQSGIASSPGCNPQTKPNLDAAINQGIVLDIPCGENTGAPIFAMENAGSATLTSIDVEIYLNGTFLRTDNWSGNLAAGDITLIYLSAITFSNGQTDLEIRLANPNGQTDQLSTNNSLFESVYVVQGGTELELVIEFDGFTYLNSWQFLDENGNVLVESEIRLNSETDALIPICVNPGSCYTLVMNDNYAAVNAYALTHPDGTVLVTGDGVTSSQSDAFCISDPCTANGGDADNDGVCANVDCDDNDFYQGAPQSPGTACDDGNIATENDVIQADNCACAGTLICPGYNENDFDVSPLTHIGSGSSSAIVTFNEPREDVSFEISNINSVTGGNPSNRYIEEVTVSYRNAAGNLVTFGTYSSVSQVSIDIPDPLTELIVSLADAYDGFSSTTMSINLSPVGSCDSVDLCADNGGDADGDGICADVDCDDNDALVGTAGTSCDDGDACTTNDVYNANCNCAGTFADADNDDVCDADDVCPGFDDALIGTTCDDGDANTVNDVWGMDCNCSGTPVGGCTPTSTAGGTVQSYNGTQNCRTFTFMGTHTDIEFSLGGINSKVNGKPNTRYIDFVTVRYVDANGATQNHATYTFNTTVNINGPATSVIVCIEDNDGSLGASVQANVNTINSCAEGGDPGCTAGDSCDDGDVCTTGDVYDANCACAGTYIDNDDDGVCAANDPNDNDPCVPIACSDCTTINEESFEGDWGIWNDGGSDVSTDAIYANTGTYCVRLRDDSGQSSSIYTDVLNLSSYSSIDFSFSFISSSMETGEDLLLEMSTNSGASYATVQSWVSGSDFINGTRYNETISISGYNSTTVFRLRCDASANNDRVYIDDVVIEDCGNGLQPPVIGERLETTDAYLTIYPNPASNQINIDLSELVNIENNEEVRLRIFSIDGKEVYNRTRQLTNILEIGIDHLNNNELYLLHLEMPDGSTFRGKFLKF